MGSRLNGGYGSAQAAKEAMTRDLSAELAPHGIRVVGLRPQAMPETRTIKEAFEPRTKATGMTWEQFPAGQQGSLDAALAALSSQPPASDDGSTGHRLRHITSDMGRLKGCIAHDTSRNLLSRFRV